MKSILAAVALVLPLPAARAGSAAGVPGDPHAPARTVAVTMSDGEAGMRFSPERLAVGRGEQVRFVIRNGGKLAHEFILDSVAANGRHRLRMRAMPDMVHDEPNGTRVAAGATGAILWRFTRPGRFEFACLVPGHYEAGMKGMVVVR